MARVNLFRQQGALLSSESLNAAALTELLYIVGF